MKHNIKNSSGKITGYVEINDNSIVINNQGKPIFKKHLGYQDIERKLSLW